MISISCFFFFFPSYFDYYYYYCIQMELTLYDPKESKTSESVSCDQEFCSSTYDGPIPGCKSEIPCPYSITYGDGSATTGYYVQDYLTFNRVDGNLHTAPQNSSIIFGWEWFLMLHNIIIVVDLWQHDSGQSGLLCCHCCWIRLEVPILPSHERIILVVTIFSSSFS